MKYLLDIELSGTVIIVSLLSFAITLWILYGIIKLAVKEGNKESLIVLKMIAQLKAEEMKVDGKSDAIENARKILKLIPQTENVEN